MLDSKTERIIFHYDATIICTSRNLDSVNQKISPASLVEKIIDINNKNQIHKVIKKGTATIYLSNIEIDKQEKTAILLINYCDRAASNPVFSNPEQNSRRIIEMKKGEGADVSCHILWKLESKKDGSYVLLTEAVPKLHRTNIVKFLNYLFKECTKNFPLDFEAMHPDGSKDKGGSPRKYSYTPHVNLHGRISKDLLNDISADSIKGISLISNIKKKENFDEAGYTEYNKEKIELSFAKDKEGERISFDVLSMFKAVCKRAFAKNYKEAKIAFSADGKSQETITLDTESVAIADGFKYTHKSVISGFKNDLLQSYDEFNAEIVEKMAALDTK